MTHTPSHHHDPEQGPSDEDARWQLATRMVLTLPAYGNWATRMRDFNTPLGKIGFRQAEALYYLRANLFGPGPVSPSVMARTFSVHPSALTRVLNRLEEHGYIERHQDTVDRRGQTIHITSAGEAISILVEQMVIERMADALAAIPSSQLPALADQVEVLHEIAIRLQQDEPASPAPESGE